MNLQAGAQTSTRATQNQEWAGQPNFFDMSYQEQTFAFSHNDTDHLTWLKLVSMSMFNNQKFKLCC